MPDPRSDVLRKQVRDARRSLSSAEIAQRSQLILGRFRERTASMPDWSGIFASFYKAMPEEVNLHDLALELRSKGAAACFPRITDRKTSQMEMAKIDDLESVAWEAGPFGMGEPPATAPRIEPRSLGIVFVPGLAFGLGGERIGMGMGFYDRYLKAAPDALRVALAFDFQLVEGEIPQTDMDVPMDWILTESREALLPRARTWLDARTRESLA